MTFWWTPGVKKLNNLMSEFCRFSEYVSHHNNTTWHYFEKSKKKRSNTNSWKKILLQNTSAKISLLQSLLKYWHITISFKKLPRLLSSCLSIKPHLRYTADLIYPISYLLSFFQVFFKVDCNNTENV